MAKIYPIIAKCDREAFCEFCKERQIKFIIFNHTLEGMHVGIRRFDYERWENGLE